VRALGQVAQLRHALGLGLPLQTQYNPSNFKRRCAALCFERYPATLQLAFLALVVCAAIAIPSGMLAAAAARRPTALSVGVLSA